MAELTFDVFESRIDVLTCCSTRRRTPLHRLNIERRASASLN